MRIDPLTQWLRRHDARGQGVACGGGYISPRKKCSRDKAKTTSKEALKKTTENRKKLHALKAEVQRDKGKKATVATPKDLLSIQRDVRQKAGENHAQLEKDLQGVRVLNELGAAMTPTAIKTPFGYIHPKDLSPAQSTAVKRWQDRAFEIQQEQENRLSKLPKAKRNPPSWDVEPPKSPEEKAEYASQQAKEQRAQGNKKNAAAWEKQAQNSRMAALQRDLDKQKQSQTSLFGVTEHASDMPLFNQPSEPTKKRKDALTQWLEQRDRGFKYFHSR